MPKIKSKMIKSNLNQIVFHKNLELPFWQLNCRHFNIFFMCLFFEPAETNDDSVGAGRGQTEAPTWCSCLLP